MEMEELSHPDSLWTWKSNSRARKASVWVPYFEKVTKIKGTTYEFHFNGGPLTLDLKEVDCLFFYGATGDLPLDFLDVLNQRGISLLIHRRNQGAPYVFHPSNTTDRADVLSAQIAYRRDLRRRVYIARSLITARFRSFEKLMTVPEARYKALKTARTLERIRVIEAEQTKAYWGRYYEALGLSGLARREDHAVNRALDACSFFMYGIALRWVLFHRLSPAHGFLHEPSEYQSLVYDLMEPYRYIFEEAVAETWRKSDDGSTLTNRSLELLKDVLRADVTLTAMHSVASRKALLHGVVLALRAYLLDEMSRFVVPIAGARKGGRPVKLSYRVPGAREW